MATSNGKSEAFDSDQSYLGTVYAKALLGAAEKMGQSSEVLDEFDSLVDDVLNKLPQLEATLASPRVSLPDKVSILDKAFRERMSEVLLNFLKVVAQHGRFDCLRAMRRAARRQYNESQGLLEVEVRTAAAIDANTLESVGDRLRKSLGQQIDLAATVDPDLIGGILVRIGDTVYDGSIANRLRRVRETALQKATQEIRQSIDRFTPEG